MVSETTIAMGFAVLGVLGSLVWYALAWYGIKSVRDLRKAIESGDADGSQ